MAKGLLNVSSGTIMTITASLAILIPFKVRGLKIVPMDPYGQNQGWYSFLIRVFRLGTDNNSRSQPFSK